jgi:DNA-binding transcriptional MerR regulator
MRTEGAGPLTRGAEIEKSPDAFRTISEVAEALQLPQHVLRFWETRFPQIQPLKRGGGRRYYRPQDVELLLAIKGLLYGEGYTIKGVQKLLKEQGPKGLARPAPAAQATAPLRLAPPSPRADPPMRGPDPPMYIPTPPAAAARPGLSADDIAALRALLGELREAERILAQARET